MKTIIVKNNDIKTMLELNNVFNGLRLYLTREFVGTSLGQKVEEMRNISHELKLDFWHRNNLPEQMEISVKQVKVYISLYKRMLRDAKRKQAAWLHFNKKPYFKIAAIRSPYETGYKKPEYKTEFYIAESPRTLTANVKDLIDRLTSACKTCK